MSPVTCHLSPVFWLGISTYVLLSRGHSPHPTPRKHQVVNHCHLSLSLWMPFIRRCIVIMSVTCHHIHFHVITILVGVSMYVRCYWVMVCPSPFPLPPGQHQPRVVGVLHWSWGSPQHRQVLCHLRQCAGRVLWVQVSTSKCDRCCSAHSLMPGPTVCIVYTKQVFVAGLCLF